jgi:2'-5' RNA ligase
MYPYNALLIWFYNSFEMTRRVFAAIDISEQARQEAKEYIARHRSEFADIPIRWERPEKLHITVKFAGSLDETELAQFMEQVKSAANAVGPFRIKIAGTGAFVKRRGPGVLWLDVKQLVDVDPLAKIAVMLGHEGRPFHPHVTIGRIRDAKKAEELIQRHKAGQFESDIFDVNEIVIYESKLLPSGSKYTLLSRFSLLSK